MTKKNKKTYSIEIDTRGLRCPLPLLKVQKDIKSLAFNQIALVIADDPLASVDLGHFCEHNNYSFREIIHDDDKNEQYFSIKRNRKVRI